MSYKTHLIVMGLGFVALLALGKFIGASIVAVFLFFCLFMMAAMMLSMDHGGDKDNKGGGGHAH